MLLNATKNRLATKNTKKSLSFNEKVIEKAGKKRNHCCGVAFHAICRRCHTTSILVNLIFGKRRIFGHPSRIV